MQSIPFQFSHGGYIKEEEVTRSIEGTNARAIDVETDFDYLFPELAKDPNSLLPATNTKDIIAKLKALGDAMIDSTDFSGPLPPQAPISSKIPPIFTYLGQFIDHDITANTDRTAKNLKTDITNEDFKPLPPSTVIEQLKNLRRPTFDLDSVYGDGPTLDPSQTPTEAKGFYQENDPVKLKVGQATDSPDIQGVKIPPEGDLMRDLPRGEDKRAIIGDSRNDENLIVAQLHVAFLRFHNAVVDWVRANEPENAGDNVTLFERSQQLVRWHYQWLVINDFLKTLTVKGTVDSILTGGLKFYKPRNGELFMPLEFSVAAYRFGHSLIRGAYDHNRNFTDRPLTPPPLAISTFDLLFVFTGKGGFRGSPTLPFNWIIEWNRFADKGRASIRGRNSARRIDTRLTKFLSDMQNEIDPSKTQAINDLLKHLAKRNLLRGYFLSIPTGQSLADKLGVKRLTAEELQRRNSSQMNQALAPFLEKTPAWYYILKESEIRANGDSLGEVGSRIVAETFIGLMRNDPSSFLNQDWEPSQGVKLPNGKEIREMADFLKFAGVML
ncbi:peroxidase family protein [Scytonema sp. NUACC26]|uniref:peroxidase family protein n=1 Tax=Scytonema sp. NUACC26 TaxID=3140176 RepID=UPI0034DC5069